jgi:hypothetical protein
LTVPIKEVEVRVRSAINRVEIGVGLPGAGGTDGADGRSVTGASIDGSGHLILTFSSAPSPVDVGDVTGTDGADGRSVTGASIDGSGHLILTFSSAPSPVDVGDVTGTDGADGRSVTGASIDGSGHLILTFSSAPSPVDVGDVTGTDGADGVSITGASVDGFGHLILTLSSGGPLDAGYVVGPPGADGTGTGDVVGVAPSVAGNFPVYTDTTGKEIEDSGLSPADFASAAQGTAADSAIQSITETGNGISIDVSVPTAPVLSLDATLEAVANFTTAADKVNYWTGTDTIGSFDTTAYTRGFMGAVDAAAARTALVLGTVATLNTGVAAGNVPVLDGSGLLDTAVLPALAITVPSVVANQAAMLALTAQQGDVAIRTDLNKSFILATNSPGTLADWKELLTPTDAVLSVAALTGAISAGALLAALGYATSDSPQLAGLNIGHATDTTLGRTSAGVANVEGVDIVLVSGSQTLSGKTYASAILTNAITVEGLASNSSTNFAIDLANGTFQVITLTGNWVPASGWPTAALGQFFRLVIKQDGTGSRTITWPSSVKWPASTAPTITATASKADVIDFSSDGTNWFGVVIGQVYL